MTIRVLLVDDQPLVRAGLRALGWPRMPDREIAAALHVSADTVKTHVARILAKLELRDRVHAVIVAHQCGLLP